MHDGIELEKRQVPAVVIHTELFVSTVKAMAAALGIPAYPFVTIPHPIGRLTEGELRSVAGKAVGEVEALLKRS